MKTVLLIVIGILIAVTLGLLIFSIINIVKCYKGVKTCNKGIIESEENFNSRAISNYKRAISYYEDAIEDYWVSIVLNALMFIINTTFLFLLVFNVF